MKKVQVYVLLFALGATILNSCKKDEISSSVTALATLHDPILALQFDDDPYNHNMHITSDGNYYYTCNGGSVSKGKINKYTLSGTFVASYSISIDMRGIMYNKADGHFYVSGFEESIPGPFSCNIYKITDINSGSFVKLYTNLYDYYQASVTLSDDGQYLFAFYQGTLKKYKLSNGTLVQTLTALSYGSGGYGGNGAVAVDPDYIYTWNAYSKNVYVYDHSGSNVRSMSLTYGDCGFSLSFIDGLLFVSIDGNYSTGTWYGYNIRRNITKSAVVDENIVHTKSTRVPDTNDSSKK